jgi:hypothetical protein
VSAPAYIALGSGELAEPGRGAVAHSFGPHHGEERLLRGRRRGLPLVTGPEANRG